MKLHKILAASLMLTCTACEDEVYDTLSGTPEKTPLMVTTNLNLGSSVQTRAENKEFAAKDEFLVCLRHVVVNAGDGNAVDREVVVPGSDAPSADFHPRAYATFKVKDGAVGTNDNGVNVYDYGDDFFLQSLEFGTASPLTATTTPQAALYWDDFSSSSSDDTDLRTANHKLQSYYGYCFNGAAEDNGDGQQYTLTEDTGVLTWKVLPDQKTDGNFKKSDLLWSVSQTPVPYGHKSSVSDNTRDGLTIPFTHAMSKVSVKVTVDTNAGFVASADLFNNVGVILQSFRTSCTLTPTTSVLSGSIDYTSATSSNITMRKVETSTTSGNYEAIVVPSVLIQDQPFATIVVDGNKYNIPVTAGMLQKVDETHDKGWGTKLTEITTPSNGYQMWQGVNYVLEVTLKKTKIGVTAKILDWDEVVALGKGDVDFTDDVTDIVFTPAADEPDAIKSFNLWRSVYDKENPTSRNYDENNDVSDGVTKATTTTISIVDSKKTYTNTPDIYWPNGSTSYYFRALSKYDAETNKFVTVGNIFDVVQGTDMLWATTAEHDGKKGDAVVKHYNEGDPIDPRTGSVPMLFKHAMSKITVNLKTTSDANAAVTLAGAKISIANVYNQGTIALEDGSISDLKLMDGSNPADDKFIPIKKYLAASDDTDDTEGTKLSEYVVVPQSLIKMANGTTDRTGAVAYYNQGELTVLNDKTYVTSTLTKVTYTEAEANTVNAGLTDAKSTSDVKTPAVLYTDETAAEYNATLDGHVNAGDPRYYTFAEFTAITNANITEALFNTLTETQKSRPYTYEEYITLEGKSNVTQEQFNTLSDAEKTKVCNYAEYKAITPLRTPFEDYTAEQFNALSSDKKQNGVHTAETAKAYNAALSGAVQVGDEAVAAVYYTQDEADAYNATLPGAKHLGDFKEYQVNSGSMEAQPGDLKTNEANPKIVMLIMLADGTTYTLDLAKCTTKVNDVDKVVDQWERGNHYTYTIHLEKEKISFRAMIKDWVETTGGGNATLEWD